VTVEQGPQEGRLAAAGPSPDLHERGFQGLDPAQEAFAVW
jgi:hypothetical protein